MRIIIVFLVFLLILLNCQLFLPKDQGVWGILHLRTAIEVQQSKNLAQAERNRVLEAEVESLKEGFDAIEELARVELGMIHEDETFFWVLDEAPIAPVSPKTLFSRD
jgi:cell division protein FtsB